MRLWRALEAIAGWTAVRSVWREHMGEELPFLEPLLRPMEQLALSVPVAGCESPYRVVQHSEDDVVAVDPETGDVVALDPDDIVLFTLDADTLFSGVAGALGVIGTPASIGMGNRLWWLGDYVPTEGERFPVYLATSRDAQDLASSAGIVSAMSLRPFVLATPTRRGASEPLDRLVQGRAAVWIALDEVLAWEGEGFFSLRRPLSQLLAQFTARHLPPANGVGNAPRFQTPPGASWADLRVRFVDGHTASISISNQSLIRTYADMGMADKRTRRPTAQWELLRAFAIGRGELGWESSAASRANQKRRERLAKDLRAYFRIEGDPFEYDDVLKGWRARFMIEPD